MANIKLTPEELLSQGEMMENLRNEYEQLFSGVSNILEQTNENWSENLAHNFSGKIASAQKSFSGIVDMLQFGADAAKNSATSFQSIDESLSGKMSAEDKAKGYTAGGGGHSAAGGGGGAKGGGGGMGSRGGGGFRGGDESTADRLRKIQEKYENLPDWLKEKMAGVIGRDEKEIDLVLHVSSDLANGEISAETYKLGIDMLIKDNIKAKALKKAADIVVNRKGTTGQLMDISDHYGRLAVEAGRRGDWGEAFLNLGKQNLTGLGGILWGTGEVMGSLMAGAFETPVKAFQTIAGGLGYSGAAETIGNIGKGIESVLSIFK